MKRLFAALLVTSLMLIACSCHSDVSSPLKAKPAVSTKQSVKVNNQKHDPVQPPRTN